jgi:hypothetical protein
MKSRIDAPGALHHVMVRGIERRSIFLDHVERERFLKRLGTGIGSPIKGPVNRENTSPVGSRIAFPIVPSVSCAR